MADIEWPAMAYVYGTWAYALDRARDRAKTASAHMYLYKSVLNGWPVWVVSWDPKKEK